MIVRTQPSVWDLVFTMRGSVLPHIAYPLLSLMAVAALLVAAERAWHPLPVIGAAPFTVLSENINALPLNAICRAAEISRAPHHSGGPPPPLLPKDCHLG